MGNLCHESYGQTRKPGTLAPQVVVKPSATYALGKQKLINAGKKTK